MDGLNIWAITGVGVSVENHRSPPGSPDAHQSSNTDIRLQ